MGTLDTWRSLDLPFERVLTYRAHASIALYTDV